LPHVSLQYLGFLKGKNILMHTRQPELLSMNSSKRWYPAAPPLAYRIGGITFGLVAEGDLRLTLDQELREFAVEAGSCDVDLRIAWADSLDVPRSAPLFRSGGLWSLFAEPQGYRFSFLSSLLGMTPYKEAWIDTEFRFGRVLLSRRYFDTDRPVYPLEYPLDELLMIHRLSRGEGVEVHAVGITDESGCGHLFLGHSGDGKSTTAKLCARLSRIYLLEHGNRNERVPLSPGLAAAELFARSFVTHHSPEGIRFALDFLERVTREIPCSVFRFVPDESAVEAICRARAQDHRETELHAVCRDLPCAFATRPEGTFSRAGSEHAAQHS
jgi:hypothetical protein